MSVIEDPIEDQFIIEANNDAGELQPMEDIIPSFISILPLAHRPIFPGLTLPITFSGKDKLEVLKKAFDEDNGFIGLVLAKDLHEEDYTESDLYEVGTVFKIMRFAPIAPGVVQAFGRGITRFSKKRAIWVKPSIRWEVTYHNEIKAKADPDLKAYMMAISAEIKELLRLNPLFQEQVNLIVPQLNYDAPGLSMDIISNLIQSESDKLQSLLETFELHERAKLLLDLIKEELEVAKIQKRINDQIEEKVSEQQKEFFLREQLKAIKKELGIEKEEGETEIEKIEKKLADLDLPEEALKVVNEELQKLKTLNIQSPEFNVTRNYLETIADLPWGKFTTDNHDLKKARKVLDEDHYGLQEVKDKILEFLSTVVKRGRIGGTIICLVGPPGVGKTSIGKSIARALDRKFFRFSVGGMRDEAEIKGHRRTYIGAMPGKFIQALRRVGASNPVILLDEIDKIGTSFRGDPASALLEVLDPEQNVDFMDHYLDLGFNLSNVLFITTANMLETIPEPLLDRMEIVQLAGYVLEEKIEIAKRYLLPKQLKEAGFESDEIQFSDAALRLLVNNYAREAGVRNLEKRIRQIIRKQALKQAESDTFDFQIEADEIEKLLGKPVFNTEKLYNGNIPGVALGLAYTAYGGTTLYVEARGIRGKDSGFQQTGQLGGVMKESAAIAFSYIRSKIAEADGDDNFFDRYSVHLHVPQGATPKDGPSAGITMALALYSLAKNKTIKNGLAMTGELTLTGKVLPIGGVKEKTIAARRVNVMELILPIDNQKDFDELPDYIKEGITVHYANYFEDVLRVAFPNEIF